MIALALLLWVLIIAAIDLRQRRVPNLLLLVVILPAAAGLIWQGQGPFGAGSWQSLAGAALALVLLMPGYAAGALGAGDVKYGACIGFLIGHWQVVLWMLLIAGFALGIVTLLVVMVRRLRGEVIRGMRIPAAPALSIGFGVICGLKLWVGA